MSKQLENEIQPLQEQHQSHLSEAKVLCQALNELSDAELEQIAGGRGGAIRANIAVVQKLGNPYSFQQIREAVAQGMQGIRIRGI